MPCYAQLAVMSLESLYTRQLVSNKYSSLTYCTSASGMDSSHCVNYPSDRVCMCVGFINEDQWSSSDCIPKHIPLSVRSAS